MIWSPHHVPAARPDRWPAVGSGLVTDLAAIGALEVRGLLRDSARLYKRAALAGDATAATYLVRCWHLAHPDDRRAARWAAEKAPVDDPGGAAYLLRVLRGVGADDEARHLAGRVAAGVRLDDPRGVAVLIDTLREAGEEEQVRRLAERGSELAGLDDPWAGVPSPIKELGRRLWEEVEADSPAMPTTADVQLDDWVAVTVLLEGLGEDGELDEAHSLAIRAGPVIGVDHPYAVAEFLKVLRQLGATDAIASLISRDPARQVGLDPSHGVRNLLIEFHEVGADDQVSLLADRVAADAPFEYAAEVADLLRGIWHARAREQVNLLAGRAVGRISLDDTRSVAWILDILVEAGARAQVAALLRRDLGMRVPLGTEQAAGELLAALRKAGADHQAEVLIQRLPEAGMFCLFREQPGNERLYRFGREEDGGPALVWGWDDL